MVVGPKNARIGILSLRGIINYNVELQPYAVSTRRFARDVELLGRDPSIKQIVIEADSPGGGVTGLSECADALWAARQRKHVAVVGDSMIASAALWISSQAHTISLLPSGTAGSVGVRMVHVSCVGANEKAGIEVTHIRSGRYKTEGNPDERLSEEARSRYQYESDFLYSQFLSAVARGRGMSVREVENNFGQGRLLLAHEALQAGIVDSLTKPDDEMLRLLSGTMSDREARAELERAKLWLSVLEN
jgi:signal peptide peptidase SppA